MNQETGLWLRMKDHQRKLLQRILEGGAAEKIVVAPGRVNAPEPHTGELNGRYTDSAS